MIDITINGASYTLILNKSLFNCINVLFMGYIFYNEKMYKKYMGASKKIYLIEK